MPEGVRDPGKLPGDSYPRRLIGGWVRIKITHDGIHNTTVSGVSLSTLSNEVLIISSSGGRTRTYDTRIMIRRCVSL